MQSTQNMRAIVDILSETEFLLFTSGLAMITKNSMITNVPIKLLIMIIQMMGYQDALALCKSIRIPVVLALQFHSYDD